jgi:hypothetical protein
VKQETWSALILAAHVLWTVDLPPLILAARSWSIGELSLILAAPLWGIEVLPLILAVLETEELSQLPASAARRASIEAPERQSGSTRAQHGMLS